MIHYLDLELLPQSKVEREIVAIETLLFMIPGHKDAVTRIAYLVKILSEEIELLSERTWGKMSDIHRELSVRSQWRNQLRNVHEVGNTTHSHDDFYGEPTAGLKHVGIQVQ